VKYPDRYHIPVCLLLVVR